MNIQLISFELCPYAQRCAITLNFKKAKYKMEFIDLKNKPDWFLQLSPTGKVPVLVIDDKDIIFESSVINELIDELFSPITFSKNPIEKAKERAWVEYASSFLTDMYLMTKEKQNRLPQILDKLEKLESEISSTGFFKKSGFSILDSAYAPFFLRIRLFEDFTNSPQLMKLKKVRRWMDNICELPYVKDAMVEGFYEKLRKYITSSNPEAKIISKSQACNF